MNRNYTIIIALFLFFSVSLHAQPWKQSLSEDEKDFYTIQREFYKHFDEDEFRRGESEETAEEQGKESWLHFKRWEWFWEPRVYPSGELPAPDILSTRMNEYAKIQKNPRGVSSALWTSLGPSVIPSGGGVGRLNCVAVHPTNSNIMFIGSGAGGLWKSTDAGTTWTTGTDALGTLGVTAITFDPTDPNIMYIATGDGDAGDTYSLGVLKSTDGGDTWASAGLNFTTSQTRTIRGLICHPTNSSIVVATTSVGIYRTTNAGVSWPLVATSSYRDIDVNKTDPTIWYATRDGVGIFKSTNSGSSFTQVTSGLPTSGFGRIGIAVAQSSPSTVYALYVNNSYGFYGLYKSTDAGSTWALQSNSPNILSWDGTGTDGQGWYDLVLDVSPADANTIYVGGVNLYKSTTGGSSWSKITHWYGGAGYPYIHADQHGFTFHPSSSSTIFAANDGGIFKSTNSGTSWTDLSGGGLTISQFYRLGTSATNANRMMAGAQDNGTSRYLNGSWSEVLGGDGMEALIDYSNENVGYGELYYGDIYRTTNGGSNFTAISSGITEDGGWVTPYIINPVNPYSLYLATTKVYKTTNRGTNWSAISTPLTGGTLVSLAIGKSDTNTIYAASGSSIYRTTNGGGAWTNITSGLPGGSMTYIAVHPNNAQTLYVTFSGYTSQKVYKSTNGGSSWTNMSTGLPSIPTNCITIHPISTNDVYVGTDVGVYHSSDGGSNWESFSTGLPNVIVDELEFHQSTNKLRAATFGRGLWETPTGSGTASITGTVFYDANGNGTKDAGESPLSDWTVRLSDGVIDSQQTDASGNYLFFGLPDTTVTLSLDVPANWLQTSPVGGTYSFTITNGSSYTGKNFGTAFSGLYETFDGTTFPPTGWSRAITAGDSSWRRTTTTPHNGAGAAFCRYQTAGTNGSKFLITKKLNLGIGAKEIRFWLRREFSTIKPPDTLFILLSKTDSLPESFATTLYKCYSGDTTLGDTNVYSTTYKEFVVPIDSLSGICYFAFNHQDYNGQSLYLDDVTISQGTLVANFEPSSSSVNFGNVHVGNNASDSVIISNDGSATLTITSAASDNPLFAVTPSTGTIAPFATKKFSITFTPDTISSETASIIFTSNSTTAPDSISVSGSGISPLFFASTDTIRFDSVKAYHSKTDSVVITNGGNETMNITSVASPDNQFTAIPASATIAPSDSQKFYLTFVPSASGLQSSSMLFTHNGNSSPDGIAVSGIGDGIPNTFISMNAKWNLVSIPRTVPNDSLQAVFPTSSSQAFRFEQNAGYLASGQLSNGIGYWLKFDTAQTVSVVGAERSSDTINVKAGWNLIGVPTYPIDVTTIIQQPPGIVQSAYFGYSNGYIISTSLIPGKSYWVSVSQDGVLILQAAGE